MQYILRLSTTVYQAPTNIGTPFQAKPQDDQSVIHALLTSSYYPPSSLIDIPHPIAITPP